jgi:predicted lipoprotein with Yx(FWY)xxD motif
MRTTKRSGLLVILGLGIAVLAGCGSGAGGYGYGAGGSNPTATTGATGPGGATIKTHIATVGGSAETVLTSSNGMTLYYFDPDTTTSVACSGACANTWPALAAGSGAPRAEGTLSGALSVVDGANGKQVAYNGHPLYNYSGDTATGQANGDGIGGKWHAATPNTPLNTNTVAPPPSY